MEVDNEDADNNLLWTTPDSAQNFFGVWCGLTVTTLFSHTLVVANILLIRIFSATIFSHWLNENFLVAFSKHYIFMNMPFLFCLSDHCPVSKLARASSKVLPRH